MFVPVLSDSVRPDDFGISPREYNRNTMNLRPSLFQRLRTFGLPKNQPGENFERPFFLLLTLVFLFLYVFSIISNPGLRAPVPLVLFTLLMILHTSLHWQVPRFQHGNWLPGYLVLQCLLAFIIVSIARNLAPLFGLYMGLIGETIGLLKKKPQWAVVAVAVMLALSLLNYGLIIGWASWYFWLAAVGPITIFVVIYVALYTRQSEARAQAQALSKLLESANRQLTEYAARVEDLTIVSERQRMARELHDTLSQGLAGLILQLEAVDAYLAGNHPDRARAIVRDTMVRARSTLADARLAIDDLRRSGTLGLGDFARHETDHFIAATGIPCEVSIALIDSLPDPITDAAKRAVSEGLTNIARHSQAKKAKLCIVALEKLNELQVEITDDGIGFDPDDIEAGHYGLLGMRERVRLSGGRLEINSKKGKGTQLVIRFPMEERAHE